MASTSSATNSFITRCLSLSKAHYFYCIKIRVLSRTSLMFLWELKNTIISTNLRGLCVIKANTKIIPTVASTSSATNSFITRCLSLSKAHYFYCIKIRVLKEYLRCSFGNSKTLLFQQISANFVILKQT